jgi:hypothetical protein
MTRPDITLQDLIAGVDREVGDGDDLGKVREAKRRAMALADLGDHLIDHFVARARAAGMPWSQIGEALGVTKQAAQQRFVAPNLSRYTERAKHAVAIAEERARALGQPYIGTEHLLLGLLGEPEAIAAKVIVERVGEPVGAIDRRLTAALPTGEAPPQGRPQYTDLSKAALSESLAAAVELGHNFIGTEHLLLGLLRTPAGLAARQLDDLGVRHDDARARIVALIEEVLAARGGKRRR